MKTGKKSIYVAFAVVLLAIGVKPARAQSIVTLDSILANVKTRNPILHTFTARGESMQAYAKGAGSWLAPEVGGGLWMVPYKRVSDQRDKGQIMISVQQKITNPAKNRAARAWQESNAVAEETGRSAAFNELRAQATMAYVQWMFTEKKIAVLKRAETAVAGLQQVLQTRVGHSKSNPGDVYKAEARLAEIQNMRLTGESQIEQRNIQLDQLMNLATNIRFRIDTINWHANVLTTGDPSGSGGNRSDIQRIDNTIRSAKLRQALEAAQAKPDFNLSFNHMIARGNGMPNQFMLLGMVSIPIAPWSSAGYKSAISGIRGEIAALQSERSEILNAATGSAAGLRTEISSLGQQIENYEKRILPALKRNYELLVVRWEENQEELPVVLQAEDALLMTRLQYLDTTLKQQEAVILLSKELEEWNNLETR